MSAKEKAATSNAIYYGKRKCLYCGEEFDAFRPWTVTCSLECHKARQAQLKRAWERKKYMPGDLEWLNCRLENALEDLANLHMRLRATENVLGKISGRGQENAREVKKYRHICANCGSTFKSGHEDDKYCCDQCARESAMCGAM